MMSQQDVVDLLKAIKNLNISVWIGGGWGVDALISTQTRPHNDLDIYTEKKNANTILTLLTSRNYQETKKDYTTEAHTIWKDHADRIIDLHFIELPDNKTLYFEGEAYPVNVLNGVGFISSFKVQCFTAEAQLLFHQGYEHNENDIHDVMLLCKTFGFDIPTEYR